MTRTATTLILILSAVAAGYGHADEAATGPEKVHRTAEGFTAGSGERGSATSTQLKEHSTMAADSLSKPRSVATSLTTGNAWIFDADAVLFDDLDGDGYFRFLSVRFDADTYLPGMYVYAMLYLSADGQTWEHYYTTDDFLIDGTVPDDEYYVETELLEGYPPGLYDVLIELYDADFGTFEDEFGPAQTSALGLLAIEDASWDVPPIQVSVTTEHGGGGAMSYWLVALFLCAAAAAIRRRAAPLTHHTKGIYFGRLETRP